MAIILACIVIIYLTEFRGGRKTIIRTQIDTITLVRIDTKIIVKQNYIPKLVYQDTGSIQFVNVDTFAILKDYFSNNIYSDTILNDSTGFIFILDTLHQNRIKSRHINSELYSQINYVYITKTESVENKNKVFWGSEVSSDGNFSVGGAFQNKNDNIFVFKKSLKAKNFEISYFHKIRLRKR